MSVTNYHLSIFGWQPDISFNMCELLLRQPEFSRRPSTLQHSAHSTDGELSAWIFAYLKWKGTTSIFSQLYCLGWRTWLNRVWCEPWEEQAARGQECVLMVAQVDLLYEAQAELTRAGKRAWYAHSLSSRYLNSQEVSLSSFVHWSRLAITGSGKVFSEEHVLLHVSVFAQPGSGWVASTGECSESPNLHYCGSKPHNGLWSCHSSNGTQAPFLLFSISLCLLERWIYQYHTLKCLLWETSMTGPGREEERHVQYKYKLWGLLEMHWGKHPALGMEHFLEGHSVLETDITRGLWQDALLGASFPPPLKQGCLHTLGKGLVLTRAFWTAAGGAWV